MRRLLCLLALALSISCTSPDKQGTEDSSSFPELRTIQISEADELIIDSDLLLAQTRTIDFVGEDSLLVYDTQLKKLIFLSTDGQWRGAFGEAGQGPGELDPSGSFQHVDIEDDYIFGLDVYDYRIEQFSKSGDYVNSYLIPKGQHFNDYDFLSGGRYLVATHGQDSSVMALRTLDGELIQYMGDPPVPDPVETNFEQERQIYASGNIPDVYKNKALVSEFNNIYVSLMTSTGELRLYNQDGSLTSSSFIPDSIIQPLFELVVNRNDESREWTVMRFDIAHIIKVFNDQLYIFMADFDPEGSEYNTRFFVADIQGQFTDYFEVIVPDELAYFLDFTVSPEGELYLLDAMQSRIYKTRLHVE